MRPAVLLSCLAAVLCAGCAGGSTARHRAAPPVPRALAAAWAESADRIAADAAAGNGCEARRLAGSLRDSVIRQEGSVPPRLRMSLVRTAATLADEISCVP